MNGNPVSATANFYEGMNGLTNDQILLQVKGPDGTTREEAFSPTASVGEQLYPEWVNDRKKLVE